MKKRLGLVCILLILLVALGVVVYEKNRIGQFIVESDERFYISLKLDNRRQEVLPWYDGAEDLYYFFLPSCVQDEEIYFDSVADCRIVLNGIEISKRDSFLWKKGEIYSLELEDNSLRITFMKSENLPAMFMDTESGSMETIWEDKYYKEPGMLTVVNENGNVQYHGKLDKISGRGNSTWNFDNKKPYSISLTDSYPLCNLDTGKDWDLLSLCFEHDMIHTKIIFDMAREIGLIGTPECTWVDLYCEGEYQGLYLLTEDVASDFKNVSRVVLLEREAIDRLEEGEPFFTTSECQYTFVLREPLFMSEEQIQKATDFVQDIENLIMTGDNSYKEYIDMDSLAKQYLLDKIFMEADAMVLSTYYYIDWNTNRFYAGPFWDYDNSLGQTNTNYESSIESVPNGMAAWYNTFYEDPEFYQIMYAEYVELLPHFERILQEDIGRYVERIQASAEMDYTLMKHYVASSSSRYANWDSYVKYTKFFLANRLNFLNNLWDIETSEFEVPESTGEYHDVYFKMTDGTVAEKRSVLDGTCMEELPALDENLRWYFWHLSVEYSNLRPVYEDIVLYAYPVS